MHRTTTRRSLPSVDRFQKRVANFSVGASTMRGQREKGIVAKAREYLQSEVNLRDFSDVASEDQFKNLLDRHTKKLRKRFEKNRGVWRERS